MNNIKTFSIAIGASILSLSMIAGVLFGAAASYRYYAVWSQEMAGKAELAKAEQTRQIQIAQAKGEKEAAEYRAEAIRIMGEAAQKYPEYRSQEFMASFGEALREGHISQIVYVPTEANLPILEANRKHNE